MSISKDTLRKLRMLGITSASAFSASIGVPVRRDDDFIPSEIRQNEDYYNKHNLEEILPYYTKEDKPKTHDIPVVAEPDGHWEGSLRTSCTTSEWLAQCRALDAAARRLDLDSGASLGFDLNTLDFGGLETRAGLGAADVDWRHPEAGWRGQFGSDWKFDAGPRESDWRFDCRTPAEEKYKPYYIIKEISTEKKKIKELIELKPREELGYGKGVADREARALRGHAGVRLGLDASEYLRLLGALNPFMYGSTQDDTVVSIALRTIRNPRFVEAEAQIIAQGISKDMARAARARYDSYVANSLANTMSDLSGYGGILNLLSNNDPAPTLRDGIEAVREQVNRVNFCPKQIRGIIETGEVRDAYVDLVGAKAEEIASKGRSI